MQSPRANNKSTLTFTLPISCQICLGKVKQPVVCPNQHVFCGACMEVWLKCNKQCPTCRIFLTEETPCRPILGGMSPQGEADEFSGREFRRARMELIYKDYESEIDRLVAEVQVLKVENNELHDQLKVQAKVDPRGPTHVVNSPSAQDIDKIIALNKKLKDATSLYDRVKVDLVNLRKENASMKDGSVNLQRENQSLRLDLVNRSPRRFGRCTVAALETKVEGLEKQCSQVKKALERSNAYVEELESELSKQKASARQPCPECRQRPGKKPIPGIDCDELKDLSEINDELPSGIDSLSELASHPGFEESENFDLERKRCRTADKSSFDLEMPSPGTTTAASSKLAELTGETTKDDSFHLARPSASEPTVDSCKKKLRFTLSVDESENAASQLYCQGQGAFTKSSIANGGGTASHDLAQFYSQGQGAFPKSSIANGGGSASHDAHFYSHGQSAFTTSSIANGGGGFGGGFPPSNPLPGALVSYPSSFLVSSNATAQAFPQSLLPASSLASHDSEAGGKFAYVPSCAGDFPRVSGSNIGVPNFPGVHATHPKITPIPSSTSMFVNAQCSDDAEDKPSAPQAQPASLNVSMTPEMEDCMRIMDEAQWKLDQRHDSPHASVAAAAARPAGAGPSTAAAAAHRFSSSSGGQPGHQSLAAHLMSSGLSAHAGAMPGIGGPQRATEGHYLFSSS